MTISKDKTRIAISLHNETIELIDKMAEYFHLKRSDVVAIAVIRLCMEITDGGDSAEPFPLPTENPERQ